MRPSRKCQESTILERLAEIGNYYENAVIERLMEHAPDLEADQLADAACIALNLLPAWYIRNAVDAVFYMDEAVITAQQRVVELAVEKAIAKVRIHPDR